MKDIFKLLFEMVTDTLSLPINAFYEYIILGIIGVIAYRIAYRKVGDMYFKGLINGKTLGSFFHWLIRIIAFVILWGAAYGSVQAYYLISANWQLALMILGSVAGTTMISTLTVKTMRLIKKHRTVNDNA